MTGALELRYLLRPGVPERLGYSRKAAGLETCLALPCSPFYYAPSSLVHSFYFLHFSDTYYMFSCIVDFVLFSHFLRSAVNKLTDGLYKQTEWNQLTGPEWVFILLWWKTSAVSRLVKNGWNLSTTSGVSLCGKNERVQPCTLIRSSPEFSGTSQEVRGLPVTEFD